MLSGNLAEMTTSTSFRDLLHAANLRHGTDGFTSPPKEGMLRIFSPLKIRRLRPGLNPQTWVLKASTLLLDHRSRRLCTYFIKFQLFEGAQDIFIRLMSVCCVLLPHNHYRVHQHFKRHVCELSCSSKHRFLGIFPIFEH